VSSSSRCVVAVLAVLLSCAAGAQEGAPEALVPPSLLADSPAVHPPEASAETREVELELLVDEQGEVAEARVTRSAGTAFDEAALHAAAGLRFHPARLGGEPVSVRLPFLYRFEPPAAAPAPGPLLTGRVRSKGTRRPVAEARLSCEGVEVSADAQGHFSLPVAPGVRWVRVTAPGFKPAAFKEELREGQRLEVVYGLEPLVVNPYETVVRGDRERTELSRVTLRAQELREVPGTMGDPFRVVMLMPGVASIASGISYPVVRGSQPAATGYFLDGVRVPLLYHLLLGPAVVHPDFVDSIDFQPGVASARYGRLIGGVVDGHVSRPREDRLHASLYMDLLNSGGFLEVPLEETGTSVTVSGRLSYSAPLIALGANLALADAPEGGPPPHFHANFWDYQARVEQRVGDGRLRLLAFGSSDGVGMEARRAGDTSAGLAATFHRVDLRGLFPLAGGELEVGTTVGFDRMGMDMAIPPALEGEYSLVQRTFAARAGYTRALSESLAVELRADVEHRRGGTIITGLLRGEGPRGEDAAAALREPLSLGTFAGLSAQAIWKPLPGLTLVPGVRVDGYHLVPGLQHWALEPRLTARYVFSGQLTLKGGAGLYHQPPTVLVPVPIAELAGLRHGLQEAVQLDVGAEYRFASGLEVSADAYYNPLLRTLEFDIDQVLESRRSLGLPTEDPSSHGYAHGLELMVRQPLGRRWFGWASYSYGRSRRHASFFRLDDAGNAVGRAEGYLPFAFEQLHVFNAALSYKFDGNFTLGGVLHFNTGRPESGQLSSRTQREVVLPDGRGYWMSMDRDEVARLPSFPRLDLRVSKAWALDSFNLELYLDVLNITARSEVFGYEYRNQPPIAQMGDEGKVLSKVPISIPLLLPILGVKGTY
jgi:TonB family protein